MDITPTEQEAATTSESSPQTPADPGDKTAMGMLRILQGGVAKTLNDMGYFPGMNTMLDEARKEISRLRDLDNKLVADNTTLTRVKLQQEAQIKMLSEERNQLRKDVEVLLRNQQKHLAENHYLHQELEIITKGQWHLAKRIIPPSAHAQQSRYPQAQPSMKPPGPSPTTGASPRHNSLLDGVPTHSRRPSVTLVPMQPGPSSPTTPLSAGSARTSPSHLNAWQNFYPVQNNGVNPTIRTPNGAVSVAHSHAQLPTFTGTPPVQSSAIGAHAPSGMAAASGATVNRGSPTVIDLTGEGKEGDAPRKRRRIDELAATSALQDVLMSTSTPTQAESTSTSVGTPAVGNSPSLSMQPMGQALATVEAQMGPTSWPDTPAPGEAASTTNQLSVAAISASAPENTAIQHDDDDDSEMEDDVWDADGLVRLDFCIGAAFDEDEDGKMICTMCRFRSQKTANGEVEPMADTSEAALVKHCEEEHPIGWATLRRGNRKKDDSTATPV